MRQKIKTYLDHLRAQDIEALIVVDVRLNAAGDPVPTVGAFAESIDSEAAARLVEHMRCIGKEIRNGIGQGGPYPPPVEIQESLGLGFPNWQQWLSRERGV